MKRNLTSVLLGVIALVFGFAVFKYSMHLAGMRIYQADECQNVFMARILATGQAGSCFASVSLFLAPLVWLARDAAHSIDLFASARLYSLLVFWLNLLLILVATGEHLRSWRGLLAWVGAATLAPLWDYGFEIRPDNLLLTGLLMTWCVMRIAPAGILSYAIVGALAVAMQFTAAKSLVYTIPMTLAIIAFPPSGDRVVRWKLALSWLIGAVVAFLVIRFAYGWAGLWEPYISGIRWIWDVPADDSRFLFWKTLTRLLNQTPLLMALAMAGLTAVVVDVNRRGKDALRWDGNLPEALFFLITLAGLFVNPVPSPNNLVVVAPFAFLLAYRFGVSISTDVWARPMIRPLLFTVLIFGYAVPFAVAVSRHVYWPNQRQEKLMRLAESLTDKVKDRVYDGIGLIPTRNSIHFHWLLSSIGDHNSAKENVPSVRDMLAARPAAVFIPSYRTDWLPEEDHEFIRERYVAVSDDFWVLGKVLSAGGGTFEIYHPGRYRIATLEGSDLAGTYPTSIERFFTPTIDGAVAGTLDGVSLTNQTVELAVGTHRIECASDCKPTVVWVGPRLNRVNRQGDVDHTLLFDNWY